MWHQNPDISLLLNLYYEFKFEVHFDLEPLFNQKSKNSGFLDQGSQTLFFSRFSTQVWHQNPDNSLILNLYREFKIEVHFDLEPLFNPKSKNSGFLDRGSQNLHFSRFSNQVWHQNPDISLLLNLYHQFKFEVRFDLEPWYIEKSKNSGFLDQGSQNLFLRVVAPKCGTKIQISI